MKAEILFISGMTVMSLRLVATTVSIVVGLLWCTTSIALPPLGLTQLRAVEDVSARIGVFDGTAYVSTRVGILPIDALGVGQLSIPEPIGYGPLDWTTRVIRSETGEHVFAATFNSVAGSRSGGVALALSDLQTPLVTWSFPGTVRAIDSGLASATDGYVLLRDGSVAATGTDEFFFYGKDMTPSGVAIGDAAVPGTIGSAPAIRTADGAYVFLGDYGLPGGIRQRSDNQLINYGFAERRYTVVYAETIAINIDESVGRFTGGDDFVHVSETDFVVIQADNPNSAIDDFLAYYPGINPAGLDRSVPLGDLFPELSTIDFDRITDISSSEGQIHLLLSGDDGLWLFAARDPSVVPEPTAVWLGALLVAGFGVLRKRRG